MELFYAASCRGFVIMSGTRDFSTLTSFLREHGADVAAVGRTASAMSEAFRNACSRAILLDEPAAAPKPQPSPSNPPKAKPAAQEKQDSTQSQAAQKPVDKSAPATAFSDKSAAADAKPAPALESFRDQPTRSCLDAGKKSPAPLQGTRLLLAVGALWRDHRDSNPDPTLRRGQFYPVELWSPQQLSSPAAHRLQVKAARSGEELHILLHSGLMRDGASPWRS